MPVNRPANASQIKQLNPNAGASALVFTAPNLIYESGAQDVAAASCPTRKSPPGLRPGRLGHWKRPPLALPFSTLESTFDNWT